LFLEIPAEEDGGTEEVGGREKWSKSLLGRDTGKSSIRRGGATAALPAVDGIGATDGISNVVCVLDN
jgi:hypothetical protein